MPFLVLRMVRFASNCTGYICSILRTRKCIKNKMFKYQDKVIWEWNLAVISQSKSFLWRKHCFKLDQKDLFHIDPGQNNMDFHCSHLIIFTSLSPESKTDMLMPTCHHILQRIHEVLSLFSTTPMSSIELLQISSHFNLKIHNEKLTSLNFCKENFVLSTLPIIFHPKSQRSLEVRTTFAAVQKRFFKPCDSCQKPKQTVT